jgi:hypothetical protein
LGFSSRCLGQEDCWSGQQRLYVYQNKGGAGVIR